MDYQSRFPFMDAGSESLAEAKYNFGKELSTGTKTICKCCERPAQLYDRAIHKTMALGLAALFVLKRREPNREFFHIKEIAGAIEYFHNASDVGKNAAWDLVYPGMKKVGDDHKHSPGDWGITDKGMAFVRGEITIPKIAVMYEGKVMKYAGPEASFRECLGEGFDFRKIYDYSSQGLTI